MAMSSRQSFSDRMGISSVTGVGNELPRITTPRYCLYCELYHGLRHRLNTYAPASSISCSRWPAGARMPKVKKGASNPTEVGKRRKLLSHPQAIAAYRSLDGIEIKPHPDTLRLVASAVAAQCGIRPFYQIRDTDAVDAHRLYTCKALAGALRWGFGWCISDIALFLRTTDDQVTQWVAQIRGAIVGFEAGQSERERRMVAYTRDICTALASALAPAEEITTAA